MSPKTGRPGRVARPAVPFKPGAKYAVAAALQPMVVAREVAGKIVRRRVQSGGLEP